jgi:hypothetical protein
MVCQPESTPPFVVPVLRLFIYSAIRGKATPAYNESHLCVIVYVYCNIYVPRGEFSNAQCS